MVYLQRTVLLLLALSVMQMNKMIYKRVRDYHAIYLGKYILVSVLICWHMIVVFGNTSQYADYILMGWVVSSVFELLFFKSDMREHMLPQFLEKRELKMKF